MKKTIITSLFGILLFGSIQAQTKYRFQPTNIQKKTDTITVNGSLSYKLTVQFNVKDSLLNYLGGSQPLSPHPFYATAIFPATLPIGQCFVIGADSVYAVITRTYGQP